MSTCGTCKLIKARDDEDAPLWDSIVRTDLWDIVHALNTSLPGWIVLVPRRHIEALDELTQDEAHELGSLLRDVSVALKEIVDCRKTYVMQFAEHPDHPHVHFHVVPRMADIPAENVGAKVFAYLGVDDQDRVPESEMNAIGTALRAKLNG